MFVRRNSFGRFWVALKRTLVMCSSANWRLLGAGVLRHSLCSLGHGVLGEFTRQEKTDGSLDLSACDGGSLVVVGKTAGFSGNALEDVVHEGVHDGHGLAGDTSVGVHLLQHLVDVDAVALPPPPLALLVAGALSLSFARGFLGAFACCGLGRHIFC